MWKWIGVGQLSLEFSGWMTDVAFLDPEMARDEFSMLMAGGEL